MQYTRDDFPKDFLFGVEPFALQSEGRAQTDMVLDVQELDALQETGFDCCRFSASWAKVLPDGRGQINQAGLDHYDRLADTLLERGIRPCASLYDGNLPLPLTDLGGWRNRDIADWFADFTEVLMGHIGDRIYSVAPINALGYITSRNHTDDARDIRAITRTNHHLLLAHGRAIQAMRGLGMANLGVEFQQDQTSAASLYDQFFLSGVFSKTYPDNALSEIEVHLTNGWQDDFETIGSPVDWCGLNCYSQALIHFGQNHTGDLPIYFTSDCETDLVPHLSGLQNALAQNVPIKGCFIRPTPRGDAKAQKNTLKALKPILTAREGVTLPLAQPVGSMHEHWNLVADIGGTNTRLGVISDGNLTDLRKYPTSSLPELLAAFQSLRDEIGTDPRAVVAAGAGPVKDGMIRMTNAQLDLSETDIARATGAKNTFVINDFTAAAWSVAEITGDDIETLQGAQIPPPGTRLVVGPGTGLGVGALLYSEGRYHTVSGEGGHVGLSPRHDDEVEVFRAARHLIPDCFFGDSLTLEAEMFLSGTGLPILYRSIGMAAGKTGTPVRSAKDILQDARSQSDAFAVQAARMFTTHLGAVMGDLAVALMPAGGVFLVGGVAEKNRWLFQGEFRDAFNAGGRFSGLRRGMNLYVSEQAEFGIVGANNFCKSALAR